MKNFVKDVNFDKVESQIVIAVKYPESQIKSG